MHDGPRTVARMTAADVDLIPVRSLFAALLASGVRDATRSDAPKSYRADARAFLRSDWAEACARWLGVPLDRYRRRVRTICTGQRPAAMRLQGPVRTRRRKRRGRPTAVRAEYAGQEEKVA